jgi:hypothetical protein
MLQYCEKYTKPQWILDIAVFENSSKFAGGVESYSNAEGST